MQKHKIKFLTIILTTLVLFMMLPNFNVKAVNQNEPDYNPIDNPNIFKPGGITENEIKPIKDTANTVIGAIVTVGVVVSAITLTILGIKYMIGSVDEKAEYKKSMIPYLVGAFLLFASSSIVGIIGALIQPVVE